MDTKNHSFRTNLEALQEFPCTYPFKFIVPAERLDEAKALFPKDKISIRQSSGGKYVSISADVHVECAAVVEAVYEKAACIQGLIAL